MERETDSNAQSSKQIIFVTHTVTFKHITEHEVSKSEHCVVYLPIEIIGMHHAHEKFVKLPRVRERRE